MTTRLAGKKTFFLPFNKGFNFGQGNPPNPGGHKSAYLWDEVLTRESLARIIQHFAKIVEEKDRDSGTVSKTLFFPRYHQLDVVRRLLAQKRHLGKVLHMEPTQYESYAGL